MSKNRESIRKLVVAARKAHAPQPADKLAVAPFGFATRLAAFWAAKPRRLNWTDAWERLCWWGAGASVAVCLIAFVNQSMQPDSNPFDVLLEAQADTPDVL